jgi:hypothetical protein
VIRDYYHIWTVSRWVAVSGIISKTRGTAARVGTTHRLIETAHYGTGGAAAQLSSTDDHCLSREAETNWGPIHAGSAGLAGRDPEVPAKEEAAADAVTVGKALQLWFTAPDDPLTAVQHAARRLPADPMELAIGLTPHLDRKGSPGSWVRRRVSSRQRINYRCIAATH